MAFIPLIDFCLEKDDDDNYQLQPQDITDIYSVTNTTGWQNAATILAADVTSMTLLLTITDSSGTETTYEVDTISSLVDPVTGIFDLTLITSSDISLVDGFYKLLYTIETDTTTYTACKQKMLYPVVGCCISTSVNNLVNDIKNTDKQDFVDKIKALEFALIESAKTVDVTSALSILALLEDYCNSPSAGCGCGCS